MTNYFGKTRLIKILYTYISDRPELVRSFHADVKEFGKEMIFQYRRYRGSEWLDCWSDGHRFHLFTFGAFYKTVCLDEEKYNEVSDEYVKLCRIVSYYSENFYPYPENKDKSLDCYDIMKAPDKNNGTIKIYRSDSGENYFFNKNANSTELTIFIPDNFSVQTDRYGNNELIRTQNGQHCEIRKNSHGKLFVYCGEKGEFSTGVKIRDP